MPEISQQLAELQALPVWLQVASDITIFGACILTMGLLGHVLLRHRLDRVPVVYWVLSVTGIGLALVQLWGISPDLLSAQRLYGLMKIVVAVLLWANFFLLLRLLPTTASIMVDAALREQLEKKPAERANTDKDLRAARLQTIFDNARDVITCVDTHGRMLDVNRRVEEVFGYKPEELLGKRFTKLGILRLRDIPRIAWLFRKTILEGTATELVELELKHKNGSSVFVEVGTRFVRRNGRVREVVNIFHDISERKQAMIELTAAKEAAEVANRAKSEFVANMSHEIRTPMTAILGFADILLENAKTAENVDAANTIKRNGSYLLKIISDILDLSKIEAGKLQIERTACSPVEMVAEVVSLMRVRASAEHLSLVTEFVGSIPATIHTDPTRLRQVLFNLIGNAIKFTEIGGVRLVVSLRKCANGQSGLQFDIIDTGIGLSEEEISRLFQPFTQGDTSSQRRFGGTGLGLAITKRLVGMLGGEIAVRSVPQEGSTFSVTIDPGPLDGVMLLDSPTEAMLHESPVLPSDEIKMKLHARILLAEDGPDNQRLITFLLKKAGAEVVLAENGKVAVEKALTEKQYDLILMDMQMPVMDGYEATAKLRAAGYSGPILALTAHTMKEDRQKCLDAGCTDYLAKPIDRKVFLATVAKYVRAASHSQESTSPRPCGSD